MKAIKMMAVVCLAYFAAACELDQTEIIPNDDIRSEFLANKSKTQILIDFQNLSTVEKKSLWLSKLDQVLLGNLNFEQKSLIKDLKFKFEDIKINDDFYKEEIRQIGLKIAKSFDKEDFIGVFASLYDYEVQNAKLEICKECVDSFSYDWNIPNSTYRLLNEDQPSCNCKWTCGGKLGPEVACTTDACEETSNGCGFLWLQTCEDRDVLVYTNDECPT